MPATADERDIAGWLDEARHAADHLSEAHQEILDAYHDRQALPEAGVRLMQMLNAVISYATQMRMALDVMHAGGLRENGHQAWFITDGAADSGPMDTLAEALRDVRTYRDEGETWMAYDGDPNPAGR